MCGRWSVTRPTPMCWSAPALTMADMIIALTDSDEIEHGRLSRLPTSPVRHTPTKIARIRVIRSSFESASELFVPQALPVDVAYFSPEQLVTEHVERADSIPGCAAGITSSPRVECGWLRPAPTRAVRCWATRCKELSRAHIPNVPQTPCRGDLSAAARASCLTVTPSLKSGDEVFFIAARKDIRHGIAARCASWTSRFAGLSSLAGATSVFVWRKALEVEESGQSDRARLRSGPRDFRAALIKRYCVTW